MDRLFDLSWLQESDGLSLFWLKEIVTAAIIFLVFWVISRVVRYILTTWGPRFTSRTKTDLDDRILARITPSVSLLFVFAGLYYAVSSLPLPERVHVAVSGVIFVMSMIIITSMAYRTTDEILVWYAARLVEKHGEGLDRQIIPLLEKIITIFLVGTALIITFKHFNYDILSLVTALGIGSLAIGMAAKDTLANMISGFTLMIDRPFRIGDRIQLSAGQWGDVIDVGLRTTKIKTVDNTLLIIPNSELCNTTIINQSFPDVKSKGRINVGIAYGSDVQSVKALLVEIAMEEGDVLREPPPEAFFVSFGDSALSMSLFFWVEDYTKVFSVTDRLNCRIARRFAEEEISIPFPTRTLLVEPHDKR